MIEQLKYVNHMNESLVFGTDGLFVNANNLHDYKWDYTSKNDRISGFKRKIAKKKIPIVLKCDSEGYEMRNKLFEVLEKDVLAMKHGRLIVGDYYLKCFATGSSKKEYFIDKGYMKASIEVSTDFPYWIKEKTTSFGYGQSPGNRTLDYNMDFPHDYTSNLHDQGLNNDNFTESNFKIVIYGACTNPSVTIGGHLYEVNVSVEANEYLTIDSVNKTIILTQVDGSTQNCFNSRNKDSYIFEKIPVGPLSVYASGEFKFDVVLLEERSEPKWT